MVSDRIDRSFYQYSGQVSNGWLVALLAKHRLISRPLRLDFLHELSLCNHSFLNEELRHGICLREVGMYTLTVEMQSKGTFH